jgi:hypothetical protein
MIAMNFTLELEIGLSYLRQAALPLAVLPTEVVNAADRRLVSD